MAQVRGLTCLNQGWSGPFYSNVFYSNVLSCISFFFHYNDEINFTTFLPLIYDLLSWIYNRAQNILSNMPWWHIWRQTFPGKIMNRKDFKLGPSIHSILWPTFCDQLVSLRIENWSVKKKQLGTCRSVLGLRIGKQVLINIVVIKALFFFVFALLRRIEGRWLLACSWVEILQWNIRKGIMSITINELEKKLYITIKRILLQSVSSLPFWKILFKHYNISEALFISNIIIFVSQCETTAFELTNKSCHFHSNQKKVSLHTFSFLRPKISKTNQQSYSTCTGKIRKRIEHI